MFQPLSLNKGTAYQIVAPLIDSLKTAKRLSWTFPLLKITELKIVYYFMEFILLWYAGVIARMGLKALYGFPN